MYSVETVYAFRAHERNHKIEVINDFTLNCIVSLHRFIHSATIIRYKIISMLLFLYKEIQC